MRFGSIALLVCALAACGGNNRYQGMDADALYAAGEAEFAAGDYDRAIEAMERLLASFPAWGRQPEARLLLADAHFENGEYITARADYQRFLDRYIGHPRAVEAALGECRTLAALMPHPQRDQTFTRDGVTVCGNVVIDYAGTPQALEAAQVREEMRATLAEKEYENGRSYFRRRLYDSAIIYFQFVLDRYPDTEYAPQALLGIYRSNEEIGYDDLAQQARDRLLLEYPESGAAAEVRLGGNAP